MVDATFQQSQELIGQLNWEIMYISEGDGISH